MSRLEGIRFEAETDDFNVFHSKLKNYLVEENINDEEKQKATLLTVISDSAIIVLKRLCYPSQLDDVSFETLIQLMKKHYAPNNYFRNRNSFYCSLKNPKENALQWSARLEKLAAECKFGSELAIVLRDRFVIGYGKGAVQDRLLEEDPSLATSTLKRMVDLAGDEEKKPRWSGPLTQLSPELAAVVGADLMPRVEVVKKIWRIIEENNLNDPQDRSYAICNDELMKVIGVKRFRIFGMLKHLKKHFLD